MSTVSNAKSLLTEIKFHHRETITALSRDLMTSPRVGSRSVRFFDELSWLKKNKNKNKNARYREYYTKDDDVLSLRPWIDIFLQLILLFVAE